MCCDHLVIQGGRQENKPSEPRKPSNIGNDGSMERQDNNGCRWEWKFSLDSDRRPSFGVGVRPAALNIIYPVGSGPSTPTGTGNVYHLLANILLAPLAGPPVRLCRQPAPSHHPRERLLMAVPGKCVQRHAQVQSDLQRDQMDVAEIGCDDC